MLQDDTVTIVVQVNGKVRGSFAFAKDVDQEYVSITAKATEDIQKWIAGKEIVKEVFVPNKLLSIVVK